MQKEPANYQKVWNLLQEYIAANKESDRQFKEQMKENDRQFKEQVKENERLLKEQSIETDRRMKENERLLKEQAIETDRRMKETERLLKEQSIETDQRMKETDQRMKETDKQLDKTLKGIEKLEKTVGGIGNSNGYFAEDLFFNSFSKNMTIGNFTFDTIDRNMHRIRKGLEDEFDIVLTNTNVLLIIEVKYNYHHNDVDTVLKKIENFRQLYPQYKDYKIFGGIAGLTMSNRTIDKARELGFFVFLQEGNNLKVLNDSVKEYGLS